MIPNEEKEGWYYLVVRTFFALLPAVSSKHKGDFYCFAFIRLEKKINLNLMKKYVKKDFCEIFMPLEKDNIRT